jgi:hypothetical protein
MTEPDNHKYHGPRWRGGLALASGAFLMVLSAAVTIGISVLTLRDLRHPVPGEGAGGLLAGWILALLVLALIMWQALLTICNALVTTADLRLEPDTLTLLLAGRWPVTVRREDIAAGDKLAVVYRWGRPVHLKGPIIRPRRRLPQATFVPLRRVGRWRFVFWAVARMYAGRGARYGFLATPDHEQHENLLAALR